MSNAIPLDEAKIADIIGTQVFDRRCIMLLDNCSYPGSECDVLGVAMNMKLIDIEIKISRADFKRDKAKDKWWRYDFNLPRIDCGDGSSRSQRFPRLHPRSIWKHYFAVPHSVWDDSLLEHLPSPACGVILLRDGTPPNPAVVARVPRRAIPNRDAKPITPQQTIDIARLANLRMWGAYADRISAENTLAAYRLERQA